METADHDVKALKGSITSTVMQLPAKVEHGRRKPRSCYRCGKTNHGESECRFRESTCHQCGKQGHIAVVCRSKAKATLNGTRNNGTRNNGNRNRRTSEQAKWVETPNDNASSTQADDIAVFTVGRNSPSPITVPLEINDTQVTMEVDTGAAVSLMPARVFSTHFPDQQLAPSNVSLKTYTGEPVKVLGEADMKVKYEGQPPQKLTLVVVESVS